MFGGKLTADACLFYNNSTDPESGRGGGAVSIYSDLTSAFVNSTFSGNGQLL